MAQNANHQKLRMTESTNHSMFFNETGRHDANNITTTNIYEDEAPVDMLDFSEKKKHMSRKSNAGPKPGSV